MPENDLIIKIAVSVGIIVLAAVISRLTSKLAHKKIESASAFYVFRKTLSAVTYIVAMLMLLGYWSDSIKSIGTYLGLLSAGLAVALRDIIINMAGFIFIIIRRPFITGERIQIGEEKGDVIDIRLFQFTLMEIGAWVDSDQSTGRIVHVPNHFVFTKELKNYNRGFQYIWNEIPVLVTFESDWEKAKERLLEIANEHCLHLSDDAMKQVREAGRHYMIYYRKLTPIVYTSARSSGVLLTVRYLCEHQKRRGTEEAIWEDILRYIAGEKDINLAYDTKRIVN